MKNLSVMIKPASSLCNMRCAYCFYADVASCRKKASYGIMKKEVAAALIGNIFAVLDKGDHITFAFQGGEPCLAGLDFFEFFVEQVRTTAPFGVKVHYALQTNGLAMDDDWCNFFLRNQFLLGLSLDCDITLHNSNRIDSNGKVTFNSVIKAKKLLDRYGVAYNILCVLSAESARRATRIWNFILQEKISYIQFIPCLEPLNEKSPHALTSKKFYQFYATLFPLWKKECEKGNRVSVQLFEDLNTLFMHGRRTTCGLSGGCTPQIIVEADGSVYPCDFYVLDEYKTGNLTIQTLEEIFEAIVKSDFIKAPQMPVHCADCEYYKWCKGGCKRMAQAVYGKDCGMRLFLDEYLYELLSSQGF